MVWEGTKPKIYTSSKDKYEELINKYKEYFPSFSILFQIAAAIGIIFEEKEELSKKEELINTYSIDKDGTLELLMKIKYPNLTPEQRLEELEKYAEAGIRIIYEDVIANGRFDIKRYIES